MDHVPNKPLLLPAEAADLLRVNRATLRRWAREQRIGVIFTPGGHRRYVTDDVRAILGMPPREVRR